MKFFGCAYYPEAWPEERLEEDIRLMRDAHINCVRMGEFNWGRFEPRDGIFDFRQYLRVIGKLHENGISTILCTPSAAPPKWMSHKHPSILKTGRSGQLVSDCDRRHYCPSSPTYRKFVRRIVHAMAETFSHVPGVVAWQLDNEIAAEAETGFCFCGKCEKRFQAYLKAEYGTIQNLNKAWNGAFWSGDYSRFEEIRPRNLKRCAHLAAYARFMSELYTEFAREQRDILRRANPRWQITTNSWNSFLPDVAPEQIFAELDCAGCDCYVGGDNIEFFRSMWDFYRNIKGASRPFLVSETGPWNPVTTLKNSLDALRAWAWDAFSHGCESLFYFRWRQSVMGEENHPAILPHSGIPGATYQAVKRIGAELANLPSFPLPECPALIVCDMLTGFLSRYRDGGDYSAFRAIVRANQALNRLGIAADIVSAGSLNGAMLRKYRLVVLPQVEYLSDKSIAALRDYSGSGGVILAQGRLNRLDENGCFRTEPCPCGMTDLFGLRIGEFCNLADRQDFHEFTYQETGRIPAASRLAAEQFGRSVCCDTFLELLVPEDCDCLEMYSAGIYEGTPLLTRKGKAFYQAAPLGENGTVEVLRHVAAAAGLPIREIPEKALYLALGEHVIRINSAPEPQIIDGIRVDGYGISCESQPTHREEKRISRTREREHLKS